MSGAASTRRYVVTGATSGIGAAIADGLARAGMAVVLVGRSVKAGQELAARLREEHGSDAAFEQADLSSLSEVRLLAGRIGERAPAIDGLINCAAGAFEQRRTSVDGFEYTLALNHLGPLHLTLLLEPLLRAAQQGRIIHVAADPTLLAHQAPDADDLHMSKAYSGVKAYMRSKNLNVISTYQLARRMKDSRVTVNAFHPGIVRTGLARNLGAGKRLLTWLASPFLLSPAQGADTGVWLATSGELANVTGQFFLKRTPVPSAPCTYDRALAERIWTRSMADLARETVPL
jgi:NAD(P)-dependent dehydrogenase (short-subunit alcohol dehydrogenase family)